MKASVVEQTIQEATQAAGSSAGGYTWLQVVAAIGTLVSISTLGFTLFFRWSDTRVRPKIEYRMPLLDPGNLVEVAGGFSFLNRSRQVLRFSVTNGSKFPLFVSSASLWAKGGPKLRTRAYPSMGSQITKQLQPGEHAAFRVNLSDLAKELLERGWEETAQIELVFQIIGKRYAQEVEISELERRARWDEDEDV